MTPRASRLLAVGLLVLVAALLWVAVLQPIGTLLLDQSQALDQARTLTRQYRAVAAERPALDRQLAALTAALKDRGDYLDATSDGMAGAAVQQMVKSLAGTSGGDVQSSLVLPVRPDDGFRRIGVRVAITAPVGVLRAILRGIETSRPMLFIDGLEVRARSAGVINGQPAEDRILDLRLNVYALALPAAAEGKP